MEERKLVAPRIATKGLGTKFLPKKENYISNMNEVYYMPRKNVLEYLHISFILVGYQDKICVAFPANNRVF